jgi:dsRNA-specific ribonuclease
MNKLKMNKLPSDTETIYYGPRDDTFKNMIKHLLSSGDIDNKYIELLLSDKSMVEISKAFTSKTADTINNLEVYEQLGDLSANKFIVWYMYKRFPHLKTPEGVKVVARLRINYGAKQSFYKIADKLGFWKFISGAESERAKRKKHLLEDAFEAFIGCIEFLLDDIFMPGVGYNIVYNILSSIFNDMDISLKYENLYDAKTRLKELFDFNKKLGVIQYKDSLTDEGKRISIVYTKQNNNMIEIGKGIANIKPDSQQQAAKCALIFLKDRGFSKPIPDFYKEF